MIDHKKFADRAMDVFGKSPKDEHAPPTSDGEFEHGEPDGDEDMSSHHMRAFIHAVHGKDHHAALEAYRNLKG